MYLKFTPLLLLIVSVFMPACSNSGGSGTGSFDPNKPVTVEAFMPDSGRISEKVVIQGDNFGNDPSAVKVYFNEVSEATIIGVKNDIIYCLAPRQEPGFNTVKVSVDGKEGAADKMFHYTQAVYVSTISGSFGARFATLDGTLAEAQFGCIGGIAAVDDEAVLAFQSASGYGGYGVRYVSVLDNAVVTVHHGFGAGNPAMSADRNKVYAAALDRNGAHTIYVYQRESGWAPMIVGELGSDLDSELWSVALDDTEEYLYYLTSAGGFGRYNLSTRTRETIAVSNVLPNDGGRNFLMYNAYDGKFYASVQGTNMIYRGDKNGNFEYYAGSGMGTQDGYVEDCMFYNPSGMCADELGNIYVTEFKNQVLRKITLSDNYVSTIAGIVGEGDNLLQIDGEPDKARLNWPMDISYAGNGAFYFGEYWGCAIRKYAIE